MKKALKYIFTIAIVPLILYALIYIHLNNAYFFNKNLYIETHNIQGNVNGYVPQGLTYSEKYNVILQTSYNKNNYSMLYVIDFSSGVLLKELKLKISEDEYSYSHVGGITTNDDKVWITSDYKLYEYSLDEIIETEKDYIVSKVTEQTYNRGDFCYYKNDILWIGDFHNKIYMSIKGDKPYLFGYKLIDDIDFNYPQYVISIPDMVQGMTILENNTIVFTRSFSNLMRSRLSFYSNVLAKETKEYFEINGNKIPYYHLNNSNLVKTEYLSPMAEGLFHKDDYLYILFENSSDEYEHTYPKINKIVKYKYN